MSANGPGRLERTFASLRQRSRKALIIYLMAGDPDTAFTARLVPKLADAGADVVELGFPFSDPIADGPVIQAAGQRALPGLSDPRDFLGLTAKIRAACEIPLVCMTYYNPLFRLGEERFFADATRAGLDGVIVPDLPLAEAGNWVKLSHESGVAAIFLDAPNSEEADSRAIGEASRGFIYLVSLKGVTGSERGLGEGLKERVARFRQFTDTPLAVGFGISTPSQAGQMGALTDGVVVGSGVVSRIAAANSPDEAEREVLKYVAQMREGLDAGG